MVNSELKSGTVVQQIDSILMQRLDDEIIMADIETGNYFGLDLTGRRIWEIIEKPVKVEEICQQLADEYDVDPETCLNDVVAFLSDMNAKGLIQIGA